MDLTHVFFIGNEHLSFDRLAERVNEFIFLRLLGRLPIMEVETLRCILRPDLLIIQLPLPVELKLIG